MLELRYYRDGKEPLLQDVPLQRGLFATIQPCALEKNMAATENTAMQLYIFGESQTLKKTLLSCDSAMVKTLVFRVLTSWLKKSTLLRFGETWRFVHAYFVTL